MRCVQNDIRRRPARSDNPEVGGSNPSPAPKTKSYRKMGFLLCNCATTVCTNYEASILDFSFPKENCLFQVIDYSYPNASLTKLTVCVTLLQKFTYKES